MVGVVTPLLWKSASCLRSAAFSCSRRRMVSAGVCALANGTAINAARVAARARLATGAGLVMGFMVRGTIAIGG